MHKHSLQVRKSHQHSKRHLHKPDHLKSSHGQRRKKKSPNTDIKTRRLDAENPNYLLRVQKVMKVCQHKLQPMHIYSPTWATR